MLRTAAAALVIAATSSVASAGTYVGLGIGTAAGGSWEHNQLELQGDVDGFERSGRLVLGMRMSKLSVEGQASQFALTFGDPSEFQGTQVGVGLKLNVPLGDNFEIYPKGGLARTWLTGRGTVMDDYAGSGWFLGAGVEYRLSFAVTAASLFLDYQRTQTTFGSDSQYDFDSSFGMWTLGATLSL